MCDHEMWPKKPEAAIDARGMPGYSLTEEGECEMKGLGFFVGTAAARLSFDVYRS